MPARSCPAPSSFACVPELVPGASVVGERAILPEGCQLNAKRCARRGAISPGNTARARRRAICVCVCSTAPRPLTARLLGCCCTPRQSFTLVHFARASAPCPRPRSARLRQTGSTPVFSSRALTQPRFSASRQDGTRARLLPRHGWHRLRNRHLDLAHPDHRRHEDAGRPGPHRKQSAPLNKDPLAAPLQDRTRSPPDTHRYRFRLISEPSAASRRPRSLPSPSESPRELPSLAQIGRSLPQNHRKLTAWQYTGRLWCPYRVSRRP